MPKPTTQKKKKRKPPSPPTPFKQFQVVEVREGREWTLYVLDDNGEMWCRYWIETGYDKPNRYLKGHWGEWRKLRRDVLA